VNDDLVDQNGQFEHNWFDRGTNITFQQSFNFGEINNSVINNEFDATIVETGFHDNSLDAQLLRDAKVRDALARASYQGVVRYFNNVDGGATQVAMLPGQVEQVRAETAGVDSVTVSWDAPAANSYNGDAATGYLVYGSTDGYGFDGGTLVTGGSTSFTLSGLDSNEGAYYFKVAAINGGGEGKASEVVAAIPNTGSKDVLIVNGFDRLSRQLNPIQAGAERVRPRQSNSFDYAVQVASAIEANSDGLLVDTASNEAVIAGHVNLADYSAVFWISGEESSSDSTFDVTEQGLIASFLAVGGQLFVSGSEIGWDLDNLGNGRSFYDSSLRADYIADDGATYDVQGVGESIFDGLSFSFDDGTQFYDVNFPDVISPLGGATTALDYVGGAGGGAAIQYDSGGSTKVVNLAFPFETISDQASRNAVISRVLGFFNFEVALSDFDRVLDNDDDAIYTESGSWATSGSTGYNGLTYRFAPAGAAATAQWDFFLPFAGQGEVSVIYLSGSNRTSSTSYQIDTDNGTQLASINQKINSLTWVSLGTFEFTAGSHHVLLDAQASSGGSVAIADALRVFVAAPASETGDFDADSKVDGFDFLAWQRGFGVIGGAALGQGDGNADGNVDSADLTIWVSQFGTASLAASSDSASAELLMTATAEPTFAAMSVALFSDKFAALTGAARAVSLSDEKLEGSLAGVVDVIGHARRFRPANRRPRLQDAAADHLSSLLQPADSPLEGRGEAAGDTNQRPENQAREDRVWQTAFDQIGAEEKFESQLFVL